MRILLIEDDAETSEALTLMLRSEGFNVSLAENGEDGIDYAKLYEYDAIVLDMTLPDMKGIEVIRKVRTAKVEAAIVSLTAPAGINPMVAALDAGADDYMQKPFHRDELVARIKAIVRRRKGHATSAVQIDNLTVNLDSRIATVGGYPLNLTGKEYAILEYMALRKGNTCTKEQIMNRLYGGRDEPELKIIDVFICKLRKKLRLAGADFVETVWGRGYVLRGPVSLPEVPSPSLVPAARHGVEEMASPPLAPH
jgi:two-component system cell cycle response regulator CtrA